LEVDLPLFESLFELVGVLVVQGAELDGKATCFNLGTQAGPGAGKLACSGSLEWLGESGVAVAVAESHDLIAAAVGLRWELARSLIRA